MPEVLRLCGKRKTGHDLEEYTLPSDGLIIRQMEKRWKSQPSDLVGNCASASGHTGIAVYICQDLSWKKIPSVQPDSCSCRNVAVFYDV